jgi:hypothetical protein
MAWPPTVFNEARAVFIPIAAMAVTKHQLETSKIYNFNPTGKLEIDPTRTNAIKPMTKNGKDTFMPLADDLSCRKKNS